MFISHSYRIFFTKITGYFSQGQYSVKFLDDVTVCSGRCNFKHLRIIRFQYKTSDKRCEDKFCTVWANQIMNSTFWENWGLRYLISSLYFHGCNGMVERYIQNLNKPEFCWHDIYIALMGYRNAPTVCGFDMSPSQLVFGHNIIAFLPIQEDLFVTNSYENLSHISNRNNRNISKSMIEDILKKITNLTFNKDEIIHVNDQ